MIGRSGCKVQTVLIYIHGLSNKTNGMSALWCKSIGKGDRAGTYFKAKLLLFFLAQNQII
jgi:hypothetical protein